MWLTLYYVAATWLQSWRLSSMRSKVFALLEQQGSLVIYKETKHNEDLIENGQEWPIGVSSPFCVNHFDARPGELLCYSNEKRGCAVFPQQFVDCSSWLSGWWLPGSEESLSSPSSVSSQAPTPPSTPMESSSAKSLQVLLECDWRPHSFENEQWCHVERYGTPRAWHLSIENNRLGLLIETDASRLAELAVRFLSTRPIILHVERLELIRIQSVQIRGQPCFMINADSLPLAKDNAAIKLSEAQLELLQSLSALSNQACEEGRVISVPGHENARILPAGHIEQNTPSNNATNAIAPGESSVESSLYSLSLEEQPQPKPLPAPPSPGESDSFCSLGSASTASPSVSSPQAQPRTIINLHNQSPDIAEEHTDDLLPSAPPSSVPPIAAPRQISSSNNVVSPFSSSIPSPIIPSPIPAPTFPPKNRPRCPPPNILVHAETPTGMDASISTLRSCLDSERYVVYPMSSSQLTAGPLIDYCQLLVVWGDVTDQQASQCISHFLAGGRLLVLCSDLYRYLVPGGTAEVRENELVQFTYGKWTQVKLLHHIFCYQASPAKPKPDRTIELRDNEGKPYPVVVQVLAVEDTWHTPSLLLATSKSTQGTALFSQIHLELDPQQVAAGNVDQSASLILQRSDQARLDILRDVLGNHLGLKVSSSLKKPPPVEPAYFLGRHEIKQELLSALEPRLGPERTIRLGGNLSLQLCGKGSMPPPSSPASSGLPLPVMLHACPRHFDTVTYFDRLATSRVGRLLLLAEVLPSTQTILHGDGCLIHDGLAVLANRQTAGQGRSGNSWLSPQGCASFSVQIHVPGGTYLAAHPAFVQHVASLAIVQAIVGEPGLENLDLRIKWPNDVYLGLSAKVGGILVNSTHIDDRFICTIGCGLNLNNAEPTMSIAKAIEELGPNKPSLTLERYLASVFTRLEYLLDQCQAGAVENVLNQYYARWLHSNQMVEVVDGLGKQRESAIIHGIDEDGFLLAKLTKGGRLLSLHPDGNSLDMFRGLIAPKM